MDKLRFGRYSLVSRLGKGGMAEIWEARDVVDGRTVALKRMRAHLVESEDAVEMFRREAQLMTRMRHPCVVTVYEAGEIGGEPFLTMELLDGANLNQVMRNLAPLGLPPIGLGVYVARELCRALAYVHSITSEEGNLLGLVHRDVSPANVMLGSDGAVKLLDFGIAKPMRDLDRQATQIGILKGKISYMSPEGVEERGLDDRADQFAVGIVLHEMLTGARLFRGDNDLLTLKRVTAADVEPPSQKNPGVGAELDRIVMKALARDRRHRFASCRELSLALDPIVERLCWTHRDVARLMRELFGGNHQHEVTGEIDLRELPIAPTLVWPKRRHAAHAWAWRAAAAAGALFASLGVGAVAR
jgi:serine/threonine-protein kinase